MRHKLENLERILREGREYGVAMILSTQSIGDFSRANGVDYSENVLTWVIHCVAQFTAGFASQIGLPNLNQESRNRV